MLAIPGIKPQINGLCIVPQGSEEGSDISLPKENFELTTGEKASFRFSSKTRASDKAGDLIENAEIELDSTNELSVILEDLNKNESNSLVPVYLEAQVTEVGTLKLYMKHTLTEQKWNLEYNLRPNNH